MRYSNGCNTLSPKPQIRKIKDLHNKNKDASKEEAPVTSTSKTKASQPPQEGNKKKKTGGSHMAQATGSTEPKRTPWRMLSIWQEP
ncbi:hypothetical protein O181_037465 [Austropuccinia psidii MF-1]|uniref:Uncharacterized protein n=1 Tax=Austropuccinia psidii MF-1 TaxID=1389203 RepID=A0A9Q3DAZ3_9BASI|nr:hypothetical protein [Austropuccinia psidii MF-1]